MKLLKGERLVGIGQGAPYRYRLLESVVTHPFASPV